MLLTGVMTSLVADGVRSATDRVRGQCFGVAPISETYIGFLLLRSRTWFGLH